MMHDLFPFEQHLINILKVAEFQVPYARQYNLLLFVKRVSLHTIN